MTQDTILALAIVLFAASGLWLFALAFFAWGFKRDPYLERRAALTVGGVGVTMSVIFAFLFLNGIEKASGAPFTFGFALWGTALFAIFEVAGVWLVHRLPRAVN